jgi:hypothetical protein
MVSSGLLASMLIVSHEFYLTYIMHSIIEVELSVT